MDVFVGYVMLDALIAKQDRHHENWAAIRERERTSLAPMFDHGSTLVRNEPDTKRKRRLETNGRTTCSRCSKTGCSPNPAPSFGRTWGGAASPPTVRPNRS
jgi:hypothetical protein